MGMLKLANKRKAINQRFVNRYSTTMFIYIKNETPQNTFILKHAITILAAYNNRTPKKLLRSYEGLININPYSLWVTGWLDMSPAPFQNFKSSVSLEELLNYHTHERPLNAVINKTHSNTDTHTTVCYMTGKISSFISTGWKRANLSLMVHLHCSANYSFVFREKRNWFDIATIKL